MSIADHQTVRVLSGRFVLERAADAKDAADILAAVNGPDGGAVMRRVDEAEDPADAWAALWNGDAAHPPDATGMLAAIVAPLAVGAVPVWVAASFDGDIVLVPAARLDEVTRLLAEAGHRVEG
ncbi:ACT domain-containing protein [uncultured Leifsonia sp.]|uniref:ACT domain-containing protein n=1 Tax=uncultured Leifsonia sp. TaxID=340359 RepID=UPI0028D8A3D8|nr:ACT domain-containing protein [uncultured Leifsonia sp.]